MKNLFKPFSQVQLIAQDISIKTLEYRTVQFAVLQLSNPPPPPKKLFFLFSHSLAKSAFMDQKDVQLLDHQIQDGMGEKIGMFLRFFFTFLLAFIYAFIQNWLLSAVLCAVIPLLIILGRHFIRS